MPITCEVVPSYEEIEKAVLGIHHNADIILLRKLWISREKLLRENKKLKKELKELKAQGVCQ